jgi:RNA polymerase sigma-70 factor, ECF subfamily
MSAEDPIIEHVLAGELEAFAEIIRLHELTVWRIVAYTLRDIPATEELVQQIFVDVFFSLEQYQLGRDFGAWLRTIARNRVKKELRDRQRHQGKLDSYYQWISSQLEHDEEGEERAASLKQALQECSQSLAPAATEVLGLRYEQALNFTEIAAQIGRTVAGTRQLLARIRLTLRQCIEKRMAHS